ncbi:hypothetical protein [Aneurinibacillus tyrosinisolvens]|nr:hypothetical protein [Aneurinibacillus tyrosinisolvens]
MIKVCEICGMQEQQAQEAEMTTAEKRSLHVCENCRQELQAYE